MPSEARENADSMPLLGDALLYFVTLSDQLSEMHDGRSMIADDFRIISGVKCSHGVR